MSKLTNQRIAVLKGGPGSERPVSLASAAGVAGALRSLGADVTEVDVTGPDFEIPQGTELAFNVIHGTFGEDGQLQRVLEERGIPYTGEGIQESETAFDKIKSKEAFIAAGVSTAKFEIIKPGQTPSIPLPYVVKAPREGSSVGIYIVKTPEEVAPALDGAVRYASELLVEEFVQGRELTVGVLGTQALPIIEIRPRQGFYDFNNKYPFLNPQGNGAADHLCPAPLDEKTTALVQETALAATRALNLSVYCRVDVLLNEKGQPVVLEINTIPGMTQASLLPEAAAAAGISYPQLCERIAELSLARFVHDSTP